MISRAWYEEYPDYFSYYGGKFVEIVFPAFSDGLEEALRAYVGTGDARDTKFVIETLRAYSGEAFLHPIAKDIVASLPGDDDLLNLVQIAVEPSGVTTGEFGRVNRLKQHREAITTWRDDEREPVKSFAERYIHQLDNSIRAEQRRSEESAALHKLEYERIAAQEGLSDGADG